MSDISQISSVSKYFNIQSVSSSTSTNGNDLGDFETSVNNSGSNISSNLMEALQKALSAMGINPPNANSSSSTDNSNTSSDAQASAVQSFIQNLMSALQQSSGDSSTNSSASFGMNPVNPPSLTKDQLTSLADSVKTSNPAMADKMMNIVNNFSKVDTNSDGTISPQEAMAFDHSNSSGNGVSAAAAYQANGGIADAIQNLLHQLSSSTNSTSNSSNSTQSDLQKSFQDMISSLGGSTNANADTLQNFLNNLENNLQGSSNSGNLVNAKI